MTTRDKLISRFRNKPADFTYSELARLLSFFGYVEMQGTGSRVLFINRSSNRKIKLHKPHPGKILRRYQLDLIEQELRGLGLI
mgnify:CR=1 FL=1|jgi:hypothetical protein